MASKREKATAERLAQWKADFDKGKRESFLQAMQLCLTFDMPLPNWAALHFCEGASRYLTGEARTLDDAFDLQRPRGWRQPRALQRGKRGLIAYVKTHYLTQEGRPVKEACADIADQMSMSEKDVERWYYDKELGAMLGLPQKTENSDDDENT